MEPESTSAVLAKQLKRRRFLFIVGTMGIFSGLLATSNAFAMRHPMEPVIGVGEMLVGAVLACIACRQRKDFVWLLKVLTLQFALLVTLFGAVRILRLAFGAPGSIWGSQMLLPLGLIALGSLSIRGAYRFMRTGDGFHSMF